MRRLTYLVLALAAIYSGYWFIGSTALSKGINSQISAMQDDGWTIETTDLSTVGFPSRFDTSASDVTMATPDRGFIWRAPFVQVNSLSYKPNQVIAVFPNHQEFEFNGQPFELASDGLKASANISATAALELASFTAETGPLSVDVAAGNLFSVSSGVVALRPAGPAPDTYDVYADLDDLALPAGLRKVLDPTNALPATFTQVTFDGNVTLDRTLDRHALTAGELPLMNGFKLNGMTLSWGTIELRADGEVTIDSAGIPTGKITLNARNWQKLLTMAVKIGAVDEGVMQTIRNVAALLAGGSSDLSLPISFQNGMMSAGPLPLGPAPRFR